MACGPALARAFLLLAAAGLVLPLARSCAAQPYADERWGPVPPPGKGLPPVETPLCRPHSGQGRPCEFAFGPDRRLRLPPDLARSASATLNRGYGMEHQGDVFVRHFPYENETALLRLTWGGLRAAVARAEGRAAPEPAPGGDAPVQILIQSRHAATLDELLDRVLGNEAPDQVEAVRATRERGGNAVIVFTNRHGDGRELVFRGGRLAALRRCRDGVEGRSLGTCRISLHPDQVRVSLSYYRSIEPQTEDAAALVLALLDSFVVEGPKFTEGKDKQ